MDFEDQITALASRVRSQVDQIQTEEATKNALVLPFINALGYNVFDPTEVVPEFTADHGIKKGEKVDYAVMQEGTPIMLFECKHIGGDLSTNHASQLYRYFSVTDARIGVITNGIKYRFFSDLENANKMDDRPFLEFDLFDLKEPLTEELEKLAKSSFDLDTMLAAAHELKYMKAMRKFLAEQWQEPNEEFVRFMISQVYDGRITKSVRSKLSPVVHRALHQFVSGKVSNRLKSALEKEEASTSGSLEQVAQEPEDESGGIVTTEEEMEGYHIVRAIMHEVIDASRVACRDVKTYFSVLLDDNNRQPICRLRFNTSQKYIGLFDEEKNEEKVPINSLSEIYDYAERLKRTASYYDQ